MRPDGREEKNDSIKTAIIYSCKSGIERHCESEYQLSYLFTMIRSERKPEGNHLHVEEERRNGEENLFRYE